MTDAPTADIARAESLIEQALAASPGSLVAHDVKGRLLRLQGRPEEATIEFEMILSSDPNSLGSLFQLGWCKVMTGSIDEALPLVERDIRLSPRDPSLSNFYWRTGWIHLLQSRTDEAIVWLERGRSANPRVPGIRAMLASAYGLKGEAERATTELTEARRLSERYSSMARVKAAGYAGSPNYWGVPKVRALFEATYFAGLRKAGVPEE